MFWNEVSLSRHLPHSSSLRRQRAWGLIPHAAKAGRKNQAWAVTSAYAFIEWLQFFMQPHCHKYLQCQSCRLCVSARDLSEVSESEKSVVCLPELKNAMKARAQIYWAFLSFLTKKTLLCEHSWKFNVNEMKENQNPTDDDGWSDNKNTLATFPLKVLCSCHST